MSEPHALDELVCGAGNFRYMMTAYSDEYLRAVSGGRGKQFLAAIRAYLDLVEVTLPECAKRKEVKP